MDDEQQGAWWTKPLTPGQPRPTTPVDDVAELTVRPAPAAERPTATHPGPTLRPPRPEPSRPDPPRAVVPYPPTAPMHDSGPPTRPVEYLTVRLDPETGSLPTQPGADPTGGPSTPMSAMPRMRQAPPTEEAPPAARRWPAVLLGLGVVGVIVSVAVVASKVATSVSPGPTRPGASATGAAQTFFGTPPDGLAQIGAEQAAGLLRKAGVKDPGSIEQGFTWTDRNGLNVLATTTARTAGGTTLRVLHHADLDTKPRELRTMVDPDLPTCRTANPRAAFTTGSMFIRDLDGDGIAEVTIGWSSRCGNSSAKSMAKLALISDGRKYIIRGTGVIGLAGSGTGDHAPAATEWPEGFLGPATTLFRSLYF